MNKLGAYLVSQKIINEEDLEIWDYGVFVILFNGLTMITTLILGSFMINWHFALYFLLFYFPLRMLLGGGHCQTPQKCFIYTHIDLIVVFVIALIIPKLILYIISMIFIFMAIILYLLSDKHKFFKMILFIFYLIDLFVFTHFTYLKLSLSCAFILSSYLYFSDKITSKIKYLSKETL